MLEFKLRGGTKVKKTGLIVLAVVVLLAIMASSGYNNLVALNESVDGKWSQVENNLQRRADLIPNLVATVQGYASHEEAIMNNISDARSRLAGAGSIADKAAANEELSSALSRLLVVVENYPNLKADANFRQLQDDLAGTENRIAVSRKDYNDAVQVYNARIKSFPTVVYANMLGFGEREYFKADEGAKDVPKVDFSK
ncbi:MAG: LemA family protein [Syntrophomonadaceae bacterium]|nr:LemA family protein [Syntrophomonadaceae bacterium]MDD3023693.1 LemA family protein [Syntrophomonadaceae bacterium]